MSDDKTNDFSNMTLDEIAAQVHDMHGGDDQGPCPCEPCEGRLQAVISDDGSAWEADKCDGCGKQWWNDPPKRPALTNANQGAMKDAIAAALLKHGRTDVSGLHFVPLVLHMVASLDSLENTLQLARIADGDFP